MTVSGHSPSVPAHIEALHQRALRAYHAGQANEAMAAIQAAIVRRPDDARYHDVLGNILRDLGHTEAAIAALREAVRLDPSSPSAWYNLAITLRLIDAREEMEDAFRQALALTDEMPLVQAGLANVLHGRGRFEEAEHLLRTTLERHPSHPELRYALATTLHALGRLTEARSELETVLRLAPNHAQAIYVLGLLNLRTGRMVEGWSGHEARWRAANESPPPGGAFWKGENLRGGTLLVQHEQGLGDSLQFCRFVARAAGHARVVVAVPQPLRRLFATLPGAAAIVADDEPPPPHARRCMMMSLPHVLGIALTDLPGSVPYLRADPAAVENWRARVASPGRRVGLVWAGNPRMGQTDATWTDARRSLPLAALAPLADVPGICFVSLQKGAGATQMGSRPPGLTIHDWTAELEDFADTAALVMALDLVVTVDTSVAHLAGALGRPVWMLSRFDACWRWMDRRTDSPWYPTMRIFHQPRPGEWAPVVAEVGRALTAFARDGREATAVGGDSAGRFFSGVGLRRFLGGRR